MSLDKRLSCTHATVTISLKKTIPMHIWDTDPGEIKDKVQSGSDVHVVILKVRDT